MPNSIVKLLGDSVYSLESQDVTEQQRGGLGKLSYGINTEAIVEQQRGGLGKISYQGATGLAKLSMYGEDDITFNQGQLMPAMNFARARAPGGRTRRKAPPPRRRAAPKPKPKPARKPAPRRRAPPPTRRAPPRRAPFAKNIYPPDTTPYRKATGSAMRSPQNRGVVKTSQIETGLPRTRARTGQVATTPKQVERASEGKPVKAAKAPARKRYQIPVSAWMYNIIKIFET